jgi:hypothetical protein
MATGEKYSSIGPEKYTLVCPYKGELCRYEKELCLYTVMEPSLRFLSLSLSLSLSISPSRASHMLGKHFTTELHPTLGLGYFLK